jgi:hypothetical protein
VVSCLAAVRSLHAQDLMRQVDLSWPEMTEAELTWTVHRAPDRQSHERSLDLSGERLSLRGANLRLRIGMFLDCSISLHSLRLVPAV